MNKAKMSIIALAILILLSIFYFTLTNNKKDDVEIKNLSQKIVKENKEEIKKPSKKEKNISKKEIDSSRGEVVYKNDKSNEGYNMELRVPEKWSHLDYSRLGQPKEVALPPEEYVTTDIANKKSYLDAESEKLLLSIYQDKKVRDILSRVYDDSFGQKKFDRENMYFEELEGTDYERLEGQYLTLDEYYSDINNLIVIDNKNGIKKVSPYGVHTLSYVLDYVCGGTYQMGCNTYKEGFLKKNPAILSMDEYEFNIIMDFIERINKYVVKQSHIKSN